MNAYVEYNPGVFRDKTILLPCDDPEWSNFTKYFVANFDRFGLKKLISTSYAKALTLFDSDKYDEHGKLFTLTRDKDGSGGVCGVDEYRVSGYLEGDGDFRSAEVKKLRDEADIIITNPPFSLFREFLVWILEANKKFVILGNMNAITYKEVFPLLKDDKVWLGFSHPKEFIQRNGTIKKFGNICWFTNLDIKKCHEELILFKKYAGHEDEYPKYDNYNAIEVSKVANIPLDYCGIMGVPITFLDKYSPDQFEIVGLDMYTVPKEFLVGGRFAINGKRIYARILIRNKHLGNSF